MKITPNDYYALHPVLHQVNVFLNEIRTSRHPTKLLNVVNLIHILRRDGSELTYKRLLGLPEWDRRIQKKRVLCCLETPSIYAIPLIHRGIAHEIIGCQ